MDSDVISIRKLVRDQQTWRPLEKISSTVGCSLSSSTEWDLSHLRPWMEAQNPDYPGGH